MTMHDSLPSAAYFERAARLQDWAQTRGDQGILLTSPHAIFYYSGFETTGYYLPHVMFVTSAGRFLLLRDFEEGNGYPEGVTVTIWSTADTFDRALHRLVSRILGESVTCIYEDTGNFSRPSVLDSMQRAFPSIDFLPAGNAVDELRRVKVGIELARSRSAGRLAAAGLGAGLRSLTQGATERQVSITMLQRMIDEGGEFPASMPYVYFGLRSWRRMAQPGTASLEPKQPFYLECGASCSRYAAATLRSGFFGQAPREYRELYSSALEAFLELENALRPGARSLDLDRVGTDVLRARGHEALRLSKFGYSIGVAFAPGWGEASAFDIDPSSTAVVEEGMVIHLVATLMSPDWGTVGLSETIEITRDGNRTLTPLDRRLIELS
jgi:Xaa-Pro dipeptidase